MDYVVDSEVRPAMPHRPRRQVNIRIPTMLTPKLIKMTGMTMYVVKKTL